MALGKLDQWEDAILAYDEALKLKPDYHDAWYNRGIDLAKLGRFYEAIDSFNKVLEIKPDNPHAFYNKACCYAAKHNVDLAVQSLEKAINLNPDEYRKKARAFADFDSIRNDARFQALMQE
ncbi:TPR end-of-group domain-containing protein [Floridanema aerugineum]|jgi:superkiller protein 3|uniref:Tetratricopeptide repeat protein n=1 Tax=Floridaenema aerugineum BLCC-F46 TaxID=3153654 RepID=A0ABV4X6Q7_9CYAN